MTKRERERRNIDKKKGRKNGEMKTERGDD